MSTVKLHTLKTLVKAMFTLLVLAFVFVLFRSLSGSLVTQQSLSDVQPGETVIRKINGKRFWVTRFNQQQKSNLAKSSQCAKTEFCALEVATKKGGVDLVYVVKRPNVVKKDQAWLGGFVDPSSAEIYSLDGYSVAVKDSINQQKASNLPALDLSGMY